MSNLPAAHEDDFISVPTTVSPDGRISFKAVQEVYATIFRAEERLRKKFVKPADIEISNIIDLCNRIEQYLEQYTLVAVSKRAAISYRSGQSEDFSDWNRLKIIDRSKIDITKKVVLECDFLLSRSDQKKPRNYKIQIEIDSINGCYAKLPKDLSTENEDDSDSDFFSAFWHVKRNGIVRVKVEYTDYMIASTAMTVVEKWYSAIPKIESWQRFELAQKIINYRTTDVFAAATTAMVSIWIAFSHGNGLEQKHGATIAICLILTGSALLWKIINDITEWGLNKFLSAPPSSTINITDGDQQLSRHTKNKQRSGLIKFVTSLLGSLSTGVISKVLVAMLIG